MLRNEQQRASDTVREALQGERATGLACRKPARSTRSARDGSAVSFAAGCCTSQRARPVRLARSSTFC